MTRNYYINNPLPPHIAEEYGELKWKLQLERKKRGKWRPTLRIIFSHTTGENKLNINSKYKNPVFRLFSWGEVCKNIGGKILKNSKIAPFNLFMSENVNDEKYKTINRYIKTPSFGNWSFDFFKEERHLYFLEWRTGNSDYSDVLEWFAVNFCQPAVEEYNRRILEAYESEPIEKTVLTSDDLQFQIKKEEVKNKPFRRVKIKITF